MRSSLQHQSLSILLPLLLSSLPTTLAQISMSQVQPITGFPPACIAAYSQTLPDCSSDSFRGIGQSGQCNQQCFDELTALSTSTSTACAGQKASGDTIIGHMFTGDADRWLCGFTTGGQPADSTTAAGTTSVASTATEAASTSTDASSTTTAESSSSSSLSSSSESKTTKTKSTTTTSDVSKTTIQVSTLSTQTSSSSSSSTSSAVATATSGGQQIGITGGGSPFDIQVAAKAASLSKASMCTVLGIALGAFMMTR